MHFEFSIKPAILPTLVGFFVLLRELTLLITKLSQKKSYQAADRSTLLNLWGVIILGMVLGAPYPFLKTGMESFAYELSNVGISATFGILVAGIALRWWAIHCLGKFFTVDVAVHKNHKVINTGPYMLLRHPSYTGLLLQILAVAIAYQNLISVMMIMVPTTYVLMRRIRHEERILKRALGMEYRLYSRKTYSLLPFVY